jgi:hypothetical protein
MVDPVIIHDPDLPIVVGLAVCEVYAHHTLIGNFDKEEELRNIGVHKRDFRECGVDSSHLRPGDRDELTELNRTARLGEIRGYIDQFPITALADGPLNICDRFFMEELINN